MDSSDFKIIQHLNNMFMTSMAWICCVDLSVEKYNNMFIPQLVNMFDAISTSLYSFLPLLLSPLLPSFYLSLFLPIPSLSPYSFFLSLHIPSYSFFTSVFLPIPSCSPYSFLSLLSLLIPSYPFFLPIPSFSPHSFPSLLALLLSPYPFFLSSFLPIPSFYLFLLS